MAGRFKKPMGYIINMETGKLDGTWQVDLRNSWDTL